MSDLEKAIEDVEAELGRSITEHTRNGVGVPIGQFNLRTLIVAARRVANLTSPETKQRAIQEVGKILYGWGDDEPNPATGHLLIVEAEAVVEAVLRSVEEGTG